MNKDEKIELALPAELLADLDRLAQSWGASRDHVIVTALYRFMADEDDGGALLADSELDALLKEGLDDLDAGRTIPHEEVVRRMNERLRRAA